MPSPKKIPRGLRSTYLYRLMHELVDRRRDFEEIEQILVKQNRAICNPPLSDKRVRAKFRSALKGRLKFHKRFDIPLDVVTTKEERKMLLKTSAEETGR